MVDHPLKAFRRGRTPLKALGLADHPLEASGGGQRSRGVWPPSQSYGGGQPSLKQGVVFDHP